MYSRNRQVGARARENLAISTSLRARRSLSRSLLRARPLEPPWLRRFRAAAVGASRVIYDSGNRRLIPGSRVRGEGDGATGDAAVDEAYDGLGDTYRLYHEQFGRNSIDDAGMRLRASVHYGQDYENAFWTGLPTRMVIFGDGDGDLFNRFTVALDVIGHELTHAVVQYESGLVYTRQPGALNEHISDVFGSLVKQYKLEQSAAQADWLIGAGLFTDAVESGQADVPAALRSMRAPGTAYDDDELGSDPQPAHMRDYVLTSADNGGVHINSGIPNRAFYLAASRLGGFAWEKDGKIWYATMTSPAMTPRETFRSFARRTVRTSARLYGVDSPEEVAVRTSWADVGIVVPRRRFRAGRIAARQHRRAARGLARG